MRVVLDTNVFVSMLVSRVASLVELRAYCRSEKIELVLTAQLIAEYERVLAYPRVVALHRKAERNIAEDVVELTRSAVVAVPTVSINTVDADPSDNMFLEAAVAGSAQYIVSGDKHLLALGSYAGIEILPPAAFVALVERDRI